MTDGANQARAIRIAEILSDFRNIQHYIAGIRANPSAEEYYEEGYSVLRQCEADAQILLTKPFHSPSTNHPEGDGEREKLQLQEVLLDASVRRFKVQKIYLSASAALRWVTSRNAILGGSRPQPVHAPALQQITNTLRAELGSVTSARVELSLRSQDTSQGKWLVEDPSLIMIQQAIRSGR